ncbi:DUF1697 domain-containing protein [Ornithinibacillus halophilus]|uniref:Uncharacterized conserved protein, DUF1697 family n=1 Tax=Ornithinibacillus halophilus TaxID=930117 RepID=A0A1M5G4J0_9BACI|nr:DUF1697 domain-containing protein [Ornithinibacillus halophilus]SHF98352.1 Uncharacterized conserved protein, DUF1697 family [Ornithinibacillus halophilus]
MSYVALLRGINLGKKNKVEMKRLRSLFEEMGFQHVQTYIQTGNVIFEELICEEEQIETQLKETFGFDIPVTIRSKEDLEKIQQHSLFTNDNVYALFLKNRLSNEQLELLQHSVSDEFDLIDQKNIIIHLSNSFHQTKYNNAFFERKLKTHSTVRNRNTVNKILGKM